MDIIRVITDSLISNEKATLPGLGIFTLNYHPSEIYKFTNRITPPSRQLQFSDVYDANDSKLIFTLAEEYDTQFDIAKQTVDDWVNNIHAKLNEGNNYVIEGIGTLRKVDEKLHFEADKNSLLFADTFGLETSSIPLIEIEKEHQPSIVSKPVVTYTKEKSHVLNWIVGIVAIVVIVFAGYVLYQSGYYNLAVNKIQNYFAKPEKQQPQLATNDTLQGNKDAGELKRQALSYAEQQQKKSADTALQNTDVKKVLKYYLIAGSFKNMASAEKHKEIFLKKGFAPEILAFGDTTFRISIESYTDRHKAVEEYIRLTSGENELKLWLYSQMVAE